MRDYPKKAPWANALVLLWTVEMQIPIYAPHMYDRLHGQRKRMMDSIIHNRGPHPGPAYPYYYPRYTYPYMINR